jgi:hypothetical protein
MLNRKATAVVDRSPAREGLILHVLDLGAGVSPFYTRNSTEWDTDLLLKKPWTFSKKAEFMLGVGPQGVHLKQNRRTTNSLSGEMAGDFMFWPTGETPVWVVP